MPQEPLTDPGEQAFQRALEHQQAGRFVQAEQAYREALGVHPDWLGALNNLGNVLQSLGRHAEAETCFRDGLALAPDFAEGLYNLGNTLRSLGRQDEARACWQQLLGVLVAAGDAAAREERYAEAADQYQHALELQPDNAALLNQAGMVLEKLGRSDEALRHLRRALALLPGDPEVTFNVGMVLEGQSDYAAAIEAYSAVLRAAPAHGEAALSRALSLLASGDFARGWRENEARYTAKLAYPRVTPPELPFPMWRGEPLQGRRVLLVGEQGYGDQIQFIRFAASLAARGAVVDAAVDPRLLRLCEGASGVRRVLVGVDRGAAEYDYWTLMLSVPLHLGTTLASVPASVPYLRRPPAADIDKWAARLAPVAGGRLKVGLVWAGRDRKLSKTMAFETLSPLARVRGACFVGMQFGEAPVVAGFPDLQLGAEIGDFADQAALLVNLDLLITIDTAASHLAGALGLPVWVMLPANADWRWMKDRADSPWYPTLRLYRQPVRNDWTPVLDRIARDLEALAARTGRPA